MSLIHMGQEQALNLPGKMLGWSHPSWGLLQRSGVVDGGDGEGKRPVWSRKDKRWPWVAVRLRAQGRLLFKQHNRALAG